MNHEGTPQEDRLLKLEEMADVMRSSPKTVRRRIESGRLKGAYKEGGRWVIWRSALLAYLRHGDLGEPNHV